MKKILLLTGVLLALTSSLASAQFSLDMAWTGCALTPANPTNMTDICDDFGDYFFFPSFKAPTGISKLTSETFLIDVQTTDAVLPLWWHLETGGCHAGSFAFSTTRGTGTTASCKDYWGISPQPGSANWYPGTGGVGRSRLVCIFSRGAGTAGLLTPGTEYYMGNARLIADHAVALPCNGCALGATLTLNYLLLQQPLGTPNGDMTTEAANVRRSINWQNGGPPTATRRATWGQVKSLYR